jgi:hypothetical protein
MYSWDEIYAIVKKRQDRNSPLLNQMIDVRDRYNGDWVMPDLQGGDQPEMPALTPALITETIDSYGMRAGSVLPAVYCPAVDPTKQTGRRSKEYARIRRRSIGAVYHQSRFNIGMRRMYRHLAGYATASAVVIPDFKREMPVIRVRDPLNTYPDPRSGEDFTDPENIAFVYAKSVDWIRYNYPHVGHDLPRACDAQDMWELVEWIDRDHIVIGLLGPRENQYSRYVHAQDHHRLLSRIPNRAGMVPVMCPARVTLDRIASQLAHVIGITDVMTRLMALDIMAKEKSIFPDRFVLGDSGMSPKIVGGEWKDGRTGQMNIVLDAKNIGSLPFTADPTSAQAIDRLERNARVSSGLVPQMGGETYGALRTGRGIDALMGAAVDPRIQEMQEVMTAWLPTLNEGIFETWKGYFGDKKFSYVSGWTNDSGEVSATPDEHFEISSSTVSYPIAGADAQATTIVLGQLLGAELMSKQSVRERHPWIGDAVEEAARVDEETMERAAIQGILNAVMQNTMPVVMLAEIEKARREDVNGDIFTAILTAQQRMQEQQAQEAPEPEGALAPPEEQPGLQPGLPPPAGGAPAMAAAPPGAPDGASIGAPEDLQGLRQLMNALGQTSRVPGAA